MDRRGASRNRLGQTNTKVKINTTVPGRASESFEKLNQLWFVDSIVFSHGTRGRLVNIVRRAAVTTLRNAGAPRTERRQR